MALKSKHQRLKSVLKGEPINAPAAVKARYEVELRILIEEMASEVEAEIHALFRTETFTAMDATPASQARILTNALIDKFMKRFSKKAKPMAERFAKRSDKANEASVRSSIQKLAGSLSIPATSLTPAMQDILSATVTENVSLIKSVGSQYLGGVQQSVMRSIAQGTGITGLTKELQKHKGVSLRRAKMIALDQTHKASNALSRARFMKSGLTKYTWRHTGGSNEPRPLHVKYDGDIFRYDTPVLVQKAEGKSPEVYGFPGTLINCSCRMQPVIEFNEE